MEISLKLLARKLLQQFGYDIVKLNYEFINKKQNKENLSFTLKWLKDLNISTIIDIGANKGQFADKIRNLLPNSTIIAFEPLKNDYDFLKKHFKNDNNFISYNYALGDKECDIEFEENEYTPSSSLLKLSETHKLNFKNAIKTTKTTVRMKMLDNVLNTNNLKTPFLVKIDVQGFEDKVICGGIELLSNAKVIICETSYYELYKNQPKFDDIYMKFKEIGFEYKGNIEQLHSPHDNSILQSDSVFINLKIK